MHFKRLSFDTNPVFIASMLELLNRAFKQGRAGFHPCVFIGLISPIGYCEVPAEGPQSPLVLGLTQLFQIYIPFDKRPLEKRMIVKQGSMSESLWMNMLGSGPWTEDE